MSELVPIADGVHAIETAIRVFPGFHLPLRATLLRLTDGTLVMISPPHLDDALAARVDALGRVAHIASPNNFHHLFVGEAAARWPSARIHLAPGLPAKLAKLGRHVPPHELLPGHLPAEVDAIEIEGVPLLGEVVFFHAASGTLVVTDLVFHVLAPEGLLTGLILRLVGAHRVLAQGLELRLLTRDRAAARRSVERVMELPFTRLIMAHGVVVDVDAKERLRAALHYMLAAPPTRQLGA